MTHTLRFRAQDLAGIPIVDHHAHSLLQPEATASAEGFRRWFSESLQPQIHARHTPHSLFFLSGLAWLAQRLDCEPTLQAVLAARAARPFAEWTRQLFAEANIEVVLCDFGYQGSAAFDLQGLRALLPGRVEPILRIETLAETLIAEHDSFAAMSDAFFAAVSQARADGYVALKSIAAYRTGLHIESAAASDATVAFLACRELLRRGRKLRLALKPLNDHLLWLALDAARMQELPVQFHTGFGDNDADLRLANPLLLRRVIELYPRLPLVLLHAGWPYDRELAHLAAIYANVWMDLSLAIPFATTGIPAMLQAVLGMAPFSKLLFATDAFTMAEITWLAARWGRWGLGRTLEGFVADGLLSVAQARSAAQAILGDNARALYGL